MTDKNKEGPGFKIGLFMGVGLMLLAFTIIVKFAYPDPYEMMCRVGCGEQDSILINGECHCKDADGWKPLQQ